MPDPKPTVMPRDESLGRQDNNLGAPGIQIPQNASEIKEFGEVRNVNAQDLNAKLQAQDAAQETAHGTPGIQIPKNPDQIKEFGDVSNVDAKELNAKLNK